MTELIVPGLIALAAALALLRRVDVYSALTEGIRSGLKVTLGILPSLVAILSAVYMLRASGALDAFTTLVSPALRFLGIPSETSPILLIRPLSGSGAVAAVSDIINEYGADSLIGRTAAVMLGSTETTFYTMAVYFGAAGIKRSRHTAVSAIIADLTGFVCASLFVRLLF